MTAGESHGPALVATLEGLPAGLEVTSDDISAALGRRRLGYGRGARMNFERDEVEILGGLRHGRTLGSPFAVVVRNTEWPKWQTVMNPDPVDADVLAEQARSKPLTRPRPGHADLAGMQKYGFDDARPVLERASARETAARVALGAVAKALLDQVAGVHIGSHVIALGSISLPADLPTPTVEALRGVDADPLRCTDAPTSAAMVAEVDAAKRDADTLGGIVEVVVHGLPPGLGSYVTAERRLDGRLAAALMGIQAIKGVGVGDGFDAARHRGSLAHDEIVRSGDGVARVTDRSGGIEGGMSTGETLRVRAAMKPISTLSRPLATVDTATGEAATAIAQRSDVCAVPAAAVVAEAMVAIVLGDALLEKFGGDSVAETARNLESYLTALPAW